MSLTFHLIPHTHWDREWYLPGAAFQARLVPMLDDLLEQLDRDPDARFVLDGQTVLVEDYLAVRPEARGRLRAAVMRGSLEVGPWYVLADELIPSGESLVRNLLQGAADAAELGPPPRMDVLYSPDAFGHPGALPALAREFGIGRAVAWRGVGNAVGGDRDLYRWRGPDGREVVLHHLPPAGYGVGADLATAGEDLGRRWARLRDTLVARATSAHIAVFLGADHHAAPEDLVGLRNRIQALEPGHVVRLSGLVEYFEALPVGPGGLSAFPPFRLSSLRGELRHPGPAWLLQGIHGTRARMKRRHSRVELALSRVAEPLAALAAAHGGRDRRALLRHAWRTLLQCQFHDTLGGCSADTVAREQEVRLGAVEALSREIGLASLRDLTSHDPDKAREAPGTVRPTLVLWNPCPRERSAILSAELTFFRRDLPVGPPGGARPRAGAGLAPMVLEDQPGRRIPVQVLARRAGLERLDATRHYPDQDEVDRVFVAFRPPSVPGMGLVGLRPRAGSQPPAGEGLEVRDGYMANRLVAVSLSRDGVLALEDHRTGARYEGLCALEDEPDRGDTYTPSVGTGRMRPPFTPPFRRSTVASGPLVGALELAGRNVRMLVVLHADSPIVRLRLDVENRSTHHRVRARFPVEAGGAAVAGAAFGVERRRPVHPSQESSDIETPVLTAPAHRFVAAGAGARGLALLAPGFFEYEWTPDREVRVTLIRSVGELSRGDLPERPGHAGWPTPTPLAQEPGRHTIELALAPLGNAEWASPHRLERLWEDAFLPVQAVFVRDFAGQVPADVGMTLHGDGLVPTAVKPSESGDGLVLRCWNATPAAVEGRWTFAPALRDAARLRADETVIEPCPIEGDERAVRLAVPPRGLATLGVGVRIQ